MIKRLLQRWFGYTQYQPGTGRIVAARNDSASGVQVTLETALSIPAILHGLRTFGQTIGMLDFDVIHHIIQSNAEGIEQSRHEIARLHPVHRLLHSEPNEFQNASEWRECLMGHAVLTGNGYSYIERNGNFRPAALLPLLPERTKAQVINGQLSYVTVVNGENVILDPWNVFHVKGFSWNGVQGLPLLELMKNALGLDLAQSSFAANFYRNGANMGGVVEMNSAMSDEARQNLKGSWRREYEGVANAFRTIFLEEGMKYQRTGVEPDKAQFIEGRQFSLGDMSRVLGLAPHLLYDLARSTNNNIEHLGITAVQYSFQPWANKFTQEANRKLLYESEKFEYATRIDLKPLTVGDALSQAQVDQIRFSTVSITPNEIRAKDGRNPIEGGDSLYLNTAILPLAVAIAKATAPTAITPAMPVSPMPQTEGIDTEGDEGDDLPPADSAAPDKPTEGPAVPTKLIEDERAAMIRPMVRDAMGRIVSREQKAVEAALKKYGNDVPAFRNWFAGWQQKHRQHIAEIMQPVTEAAAAGQVSIATDYIDQHISRTQTDIDQIMSADPANRSDAIWSVMESWKDRTEQSTNEIMVIKGDNGDGKVAT